MRYDWDKYGRPRVALVNRSFRWVLAFLGVALWVTFGPMIADDWTLVIPPLGMTAGVVLQQIAVRKVYGVQVKPDHAVIASDGGQP